MASSPSEEEEVAFSTADAGNGNPKARLQVFGRSMSRTFKALSEWGDNFERNHLDGDWRAAVSSAQKKVGERASRIGEELGSATVKLVEEATGRGPGQPPIAGAAPPAYGAAAVPETLASWVANPKEPSPSRASSARGLPVAVGTVVAGSAAPSASSQSPPGGQPVAAAVALPAAALAASSAETATASLWTEAECLREELAKEREQRRGRASAKGALDEALRQLRREVVEERRDLEAAEAARTVANSRFEALERQLEELSAEHRTVTSRNNSLKAELRRQALALAAAERAERLAKSRGEAEGAHCWAREGPETEALKAAKLSLAEVLASMDEVRLKERVEAQDLQKEIDTARTEQHLLKELAALGGRQRLLPPAGDSTARIPFWQRLRGGERARSGPLATCTVVEE